MKKDISLKDIKVKFVEITKNIFEFLKEYYLVLTFIGTVFGLLFYSMGYFFLYGYFFGGIDKGFKAFIYFLINPIPFGFKQVLIVGSILLAILVMFWYIIKELNNNYLLNTILLIVLHLFIVFVFLGYQKNIEIITSLTVWIVPMFIIGFIKYLQVIMNRPIFMFASFSYITILIWLMVITKNIKYSDFIINFSQFILMFLTVFLNKLKRESKYYDFVVFLPMSVAVILFLFSLFVNKMGIAVNYVAYTISIIIGVIILFWIFRCNRNKIRERFDRVKDDRNLNRENSDWFKKIVDMGIAKIAFVAIFIFLNVTIILYTGLFILGESVKYFVWKTDDGIITYTFNGEEKDIIGKVVASKKDMYYISDKNDNLVLIKTKELYIRENK